MAKNKKQADDQGDDDQGDESGDFGLVCGANVKHEKQVWDWPGMILRNSLNIIDGTKGTGKSSVLAHIAACLCAGKRLPESKSAGPKGSCLWFGSEEAFGGSVLGRWKANGMPPATIHTLPPNTASAHGPLVLPHQEDRLREICKHVRARVIVLDPWTSLADGSLDVHHQQSTRLYLEALGRVAHDEKVTVLMARHLTKSRGSSLLNQGMGSVAIANTCRSVLRTERDQQNPAICYLACLISNAGGADGVIPYSLTAVDQSVFTVKFGTRKDTRLEEVIECLEEPHERDAIADARRLLLAALANGPVEAEKLVDEAGTASISERTLRKAKAELGIKSKRRGGGKGTKAVWTWHLPK